MSHQLAADLKAWNVVLIDDSVVRVCAHNVLEEAESYTFSLVMEGQPGYGIGVARFPKSACAPEDAIKPDDRGLQARDEKPSLRVAHLLEFDPAEWEVTTISGEVVKLYADAYGRDGGHYDFVLLMSGAPAYEVEVARFPKSAVAEPVGGWIAAGRVFESWHEPDGDAL